MYWRAVKENKLTLTGYILSATGISLSLLLDTELAASLTNNVEAYLQATRTTTFIGAGLLGISIFGISTLSTYQQTRDHINKYKHINKTYADKHFMYCDRAGVRLAAKQAGIKNPYTQ
jgi:hypothetical protein